MIDYLFYLVLAFAFYVSLPTAAVAGYAMGLLVAYFFIAYKVMNDGWLSDRRHYEAILFLISGLLGMLLTYCSASALLGLIGDRTHFIKLGAAGVSFFGVYLFRLVVVFRRGSA